ncbi:hypothetical protein Tco_0788160 [Tanacetum coccineum]
MHNAVTVWLVLALRGSGSEIVAARVPKKVMRGAGKFWHNCTHGASGSCEPTYITVSTGILNLPTFAEDVVSNKGTVSLLSSKDNFIIIPESKRIKTKPDVTIFDLCRSGWWRRLMVAIMFVALGDLWYDDSARLRCGGDSGYNVPATYVTLWAVGICLRNIRGYNMSM